MLSGLQDPVKTNPKLFENRSKVESKIMSAECSLEEYFSNGFGDPKTATDGRTNIKNSYLFELAPIAVPRSLLAPYFGFLLWAPLPIFTASLLAINLCEYEYVRL